MGLPPLPLHWVGTAGVRAGFPKQTPPVLRGLLYQPREKRGVSSLAYKERLHCST